ncbi:hypothetical protein RHMOL_Rhmol02G0067200 [Rhododendron molle]|uniref:Uncharacterized protein n=1 Tax=Rhododendron molle TaxID=49168 RepID=A0ACC0PNR8_RHOML|nr:hypothetical protein RHMOL_Rhmol02G0067200 [Rhododendron molle]
MEAGESDEHFCSDAAERSASKHILVVFIKKSIAHCLPQQYVLRRWTTNTKSDDAHETFSHLMRQNSVQEGMEISPILVRHGLMIEVMKVVEEWQKSQEKRDHLTLALKKLHCELLTMDDGSDKIENDDDLEGATLVEDKYGLPVDPDKTFSYIICEWKWRFNTERQQKEMGAKPGEEVVRAKGGGEGTEAAANSIAGGARTKPVAASVFPTKKKLVKTMMWDSMVQATVSAAPCFGSASVNNNNNNHHHSNDNKTFAA